MNKAFKFTLDVDRRKAIEEREEKFAFKPLSAEELEDSEEEYYDNGAKVMKMPDVTALIEAVSL